MGQAQQTGALLALGAALLHFRLSFLLAASGLFLCIFLLYLSFNGKTLPILALVCCSNFSCGTWLGLHRFDRGYELKQTHTHTHILNFGMRFVCEC
jgi:hypothetical protein